MTWLTVRETASICDVTESAIWKAVKLNKYEYRHVKGIGRGGKQIQIALESLPETAQARFHGEKQPQEDILQYTGKQRVEADFRALVVAEYQHSGLSPDEYVAKFNCENPPEDAITTSKLFRWQKQYREGGVVGLIDQRGGHNRDQTSISTLEPFFIRISAGMRNRLIMRFMSFREIPRSCIFIPFYPAVILHFPRFPGLFQIQNAHALTFCALFTYILRAAPHLRRPASNNLHATLLDFFHKSGMISREQMFRAAALREVCVWHRKICW